MYVDLYYFPYPSQKQLQVKYLWVFDPKALHHVVLKDQDVYEEAEHMLKYSVVPFYS